MPDQLDAIYAPSADALSPRPARPARPARPGQARRAAGKPGDRAEAEASPQAGQRDKRMSLSESQTAQLTGGEDGVLDLIEVNHSVLKGLAGVAPSYEEA